MPTCLHPKIVHGVLVPCQKCPVCLQNKRQSIANRFLLEMGFSGGSTYFITWTVDTEHMSYCLEPNRHDGPLWPCFRKDLFRKMFDAMRYKYSFKYFVVAEYGDLSARIHYHGLLFFKDHFYQDEVEDICNHYWHEGFVTVGPPTDRRIAYCAKYALKETEFTTFKDRNDCRYNFRLFSNGLGLSALDWLNEYLYNDGKYRTTIEAAGNRVCLDQFYKRHVDPSLLAEVKARGYDRNFDEIQANMSKSFKKNGIFDEVQKKWLPDYTIDDKIIQRRRNQRLLSKTKKL